VLREDVERRLREDHRLTDMQIAECFELASEDPGSLDLRDMLEAPRAIAGEVRKKSAADRSI
jgi:hypothetical protein